MSADNILFREEDIHGTGDIYFVWQPGASALLLASTGSDGSVAIFNRKGELQERIILQGQVNQLELLFQSISSFILIF
jgi:WD repeat-containing protein 19